MNSDYITESNVNNVRQQVLQIREPVPYLATIANSSQVLTDFDSFPYTRWWRGVPDSSVPIVIEREAGWRPHHNNCYTSQCPLRKNNKPHRSFQTTCKLPNYLHYLNN